MPRLDKLVPLLDIALLKKRLRCNKAGQMCPALASTAMPGRAGDIRLQRCRPSVFMMACREFESLGGRGAKSLEIIETYGKLAGQKNLMLVSLGFA